MSERLTERLTESLTEPLTEQLCRMLRGDAPDWPRDAASADALLAAATDHGVAPLVASRLTRLPGTPCPPWVREPFEAALRDQAVEEQVTRLETRRLLDALATAGLSPLLFKGGALAFTHYDDPALRPRVDLDLLVRPAEVRAASATLTALGYRAALTITDEMVRAAAGPTAIDGYFPSSQIPFTRAGAHGTHLEVDLHWRPTIPQTLAQVFDPDALHAASVEVPALGPQARAFGPTHALVLACLHRLAHHHGVERLIWLYDLHLLATRLEAEGARSVVRMAREHRVAGICADGLARAAACVGTALPAGLLEALRAAAEAGPEPSALYLNTQVRPVDVLRADLGTVASWRGRLRLVREHLFPPSAYVLKRYGLTSRVWLPALYAHRAAAGARRWLTGR